MDKKTMRYQFIVRLIGIIIGSTWFEVSEYSVNKLLVAGSIGFYLGGVVCIRFMPKFRALKYHIYFLYIDVMLLSITIAIRGGLRSDFYLGYFLVLGYVLLIKDEYLLIKLCGTIFISYTGVTVYFTDPEIFEVSRLVIRIGFIGGIGFLLNQYFQLLLNSEKMHEKAFNMTLIDALTGVYNRRILEHSEELFDLEKNNIFIAFIDLDDFKAVNDTYGHQAGDEVLQGLAECIKSELDEESICVRYGGEEFLIIEKISNEEEFIKIIKSIQKRFKGLRFSWQKKDACITFTTGISFKEIEESLDVAIKRADEALYKGKNKGKDCIVKR